MADLISTGINGAPRKAQWTGTNGLTTTGTMNPLGLTQNDPSMGYMGAQPPAQPAQQPAAPAQPAAPQAAPAAAPPASNAPAPGSIFTGQGGSQQTWNGTGWDTAPPPTTLNQILGGQMGQAPSQSQPYQQWHSGLAGALRGANLPPDQQGINGTYNPETGKTDYQTANGMESMDESGNWFDASGAAKTYGPPPPQANYDLLVGRRRQQQGQDYGAGANPSDVYHVPQNPEAQASQILGQNQPGGRMRPISPRFSPSGAPQWGSRSARGSLSRRMPG